MSCADSPHNPATEEKMTRTSDVGDKDKPDELRDLPHGREVHVEGIPSDVSEDDLKKKLEEVGGVVVHLILCKGKSKNYAFVVFKNSSQDIRRLNQIYLEGNKISASFSNAKRNFKKAEEEVVPEILKIRLMMPVEMAHEDVIGPYTIGDKEGHIKFITELRRKLSKLKEGTDVVDDIFEGDCAHPLLDAKPSGKKAVQWIHVVLRAIVEKGKVIQTTLAVRKDNLYVKGFMNKDGQWFELPGNAANDDMKLPEGYKARKLKGWDVSYRGLMNLGNKNQVKKTLMSTRLCKAFAVRAVRRLWGYRMWDENDKNWSLPEKTIDENLTRMALAGLMVMICEAARMNPFLDTIAGGWDGGTGLTSRLLDIMWDWGSMSAALLKWKKSGKWPIKCKHGLATALASINLVLDSTDVTGSGPTWVEIFAVSSNFPVISVTVIDEGNCKHMIYKQETEQVQEGQTQQGIVPSKLTVKGRRISGYESFGMEVVLPPSTCSGDSITKKFKWDCRKQDGEVVTRTINLDHGRKIAVTYLVMNNAVEAKVEVKLRLIGNREESPEYWSNQRGRVPMGTKKTGGKKGPEGMEGIAKKVGGKKYTARGEIIAQIDGFEDHQIVLFRTEGEEEFPLDLETSILMRSSVSVPFGKGLHIDMVALHIKEAPGDRLVKKPSRLSYDFGRWTPTTSLAVHQVDDNIEVEVKVTWPAQEEMVEREPDVVFIIGDREKFTSSIKELRGVLMHHANPEDALHGCKDKELLDTGEHPALARPRPSQQPPRWIHVKLRVVAGEETSSTTLALRDDQCYGAGFMNQNGVWYDLGQGPWWWHDCDKQLPPEYNSVRLDWDYHLRSDIAQIDYDCISERLGRIRLGKESARAAVRTLSRYPDVEEREKPMLALAELIIMVCESARFNSIFKSIATRWNKGMVCPKKLYEYTRSWRQISLALLRWKDHGHNSNRWPLHSEMGINRPVDALRVVCLVFNSDERTKQIDMEYTIGNKKGYSRFIKELRDELAQHDHQEGILDGHPNPDSVSAYNPALLARQRRRSWPARLIHIKLRLAEEEAEEETWTTLAVRDDNAYLLGFMNQKGVWYDLQRVWYELQSKDERLPAEFNPEQLWWGSYKDILGIRDRLAYLSLSTENQYVDVSAWDKVREKLGTEGLGKDFAVKAVRTLSRYPVVEEGDCPRLALAGLIIMVCESARLNPVHDHIEAGWDGTVTGFSKQLMEYVQRSDLISETLLLWKASGYRGWPGGNHDGPDEAILDMMYQDTKLHRMGIRSPEHALDSVHLVPSGLLPWDKL